MNARRVLGLVVVTLALITVGTGIWFRAYDAGQANGLADGLAQSGNVSTVVVTDRAGWGHHGAGFFPFGIFLFPLFFFGFFALMRFVLWRGPWGGPGARMGGPWGPGGWTNGEIPPHIQEMHRKMHEKETPS